MVRGAVVGTIEKDYGECFGFWGEPGWILGEQNWNFVELFIPNLQN